MTPSQAGDLMRCCRAAVARGVIAAEVTAVLDYLLFLARKPGQDRCQASLSTMQRNLHLRRQKLIDAIRRLEQLGVLRKVKTRVRVAWQGLFASRQGTNIYVFTKPVAAATEFRGRTTIREEEKRRLLGGAKIVGESGLEHALSRLGRAMVKLV